MAEVHIIGQIVGASKFPKQNLFCKWQIHAGPTWRLISGINDGQTQVDSPLYGDISYWCHPVDVHFATKGIQGWPRFHVQVYHLDHWGRSEIYGYGFCHIPSSPGEHSIKCVTWRPIGNLRDQINQYFVGGGPQLKNPETVFCGTDRYRLQTETMGIVHANIGVILRNFNKFGIDC